tara:strand:+ start:1551 stop:2813 length:1263 start_codon:yes stop_codon:yes gene_type:complete
VSNPRGADDAVRRARIAVSVLFFTNALTLSAWLPRLAELQADISLTDVALGAALAAGAAGGIAAGVSAGPLIHRWGSQRVAMAALFIVAPILPFIGLVPGAWTLGFVLLLVGGLDAVMDAAMNSHAMRVQHEMRATGVHRSILNTFHGYWSLGAVAGGLIGVATAAISLPIAWMLAAVALLCSVLVLVARPWLLPGKDPDSFLDTDDDPIGDAQPDPSSLLAAGPANADERSATTRVLHRPIIWGLGLFIILAVMIEDIPGRWSSIYLTDIGAPSATVGWGFVAFTMAMTIGRFSGDRIVDALGERRWTRVAMSGTAVVLGLSLLAQSPWLFMIGCAVTGFGVATLFPAAMRAAAHLPGIRPATGVATISWLSRAGFVTAPLIVGVIAENFSVAWGISVTVIAALILLPLSSILTWEKSR